MKESRLVSMQELTKRVITKARAGILPVQNRTRDLVSDPILDTGDTSTDQNSDDDCAEEGYSVLGIDRPDVVHRSVCPTDSSDIDDEIAELIDSETGEYPTHDDLMVSSAMMAAIDDPEDVEDIDKS
jgi:hypothetical protein